MVIGAHVCCLVMGDVPYMLYSRQAWYIAGRQGRGCLQYLCRKDGRLSAGLPSSLAQGTVYDYYVNFKQSRFSPWSDLVQVVEYDSSVPMSQVWTAGRWERSGL